MSEVRPENPYVGLRPFDRDDSHLFFGRIEQLTELLERLYQTRFLGVVGSSGCGKSSLVRAGLVPALLGGFLVEERDRWHVATLQPGGAPLRNLAAALAATTATGSGPPEVAQLSAAIEEGHAEALTAWLAAAMDEKENLLLVVDQFEEVFAFRGRDQANRDGDRSPAERRELNRRRAEAADFVDLVLALAEQRRLPVYVVLTMRSDYLGDCDVFTGLPEAMNAGRYLVPRLTRRQMQEAIEGPARLFGAAVHPRLTDRLLNDSGTEADGLPLLEHALMRIWDRWVEDGGEGPLGLKQYEAIGTLERALSEHAEEALRNVEEGVAARVFQRLTDTDSQGRSVRRACRFGELVAVCGGEGHRAAIEGVLREFGAEGRSFLILHEELAGDPRVVISHESLIRNWERLRRWAAGERIAKERFQELVRRAGAWQAGRGSLLQGTDLSLALAWQKKAAPSAAWAERYRRHEEDLPEVRRFLRFSALRRLLVLGVGIAAAALLVALTIRATVLARAAREQSRMAVAAQWMEADPSHAGLVLGELERPAANPEALAMMRRVLGEPLTLASFRHAGRVVSAAFSPDGERVVTASDDGTARVWGADGRGRPVPLAGHEGALVSAAFSPDGRWLLTASTDGTARLWNADGGRPAVLAGHRKAVVGAAFSPDSERVVTASTDGTAQVWGTRGSAPQVVLPGHGGAVWSAAFSPGGERVVTASDDGTARVWSADQGTVLVRLVGHQGPVGTAAFSPDGQRIATASSDHTARLWDARDGSALATLVGHQGPVVGAAFSPGGERVVTASSDGTARVWNAVDGSDPVVLAGHAGAVRSAAFSADGERVVTASDDGTARVWSRGGGRALGTLTGHGGAVVGAAFSADGGRIVTASWDGSARVWGAPGAPPLGALEEPAVLDGHERGVLRAVFGPDGRRIVTASLDGRARVWAADGSGGWSDSPLVVASHRGSVRSAAFSPDGRAFVTASWDGTARVWVADGRGVLATLRGHRSGVETATFSPDGRRVVTASKDGTARVWRADGAGEPEVLEHPAAVDSAAFSPDGDRVVTASKDRKARVWRADGVGKPVVLEHPAAVESAAFSPDGGRVVTASKDRKARVWRADGAGKPVVLEHPAAVESAAFSPDERRIVTAARDGRARIWNADGRGEPMLLEHPSPVGNAAFSPDGRRIVTTSGATVRVWLVAGLGRPVVLEGHRGKVQSAVFSPDGRQVLTASSDGTARVWSLTPARLLEAIRSRTTLCLDPEFRQCHFGDSAQAARSRFQSCERAQGRGPTG